MELKNLLFSVIGGIVVGVVMLVISKTSKNKDDQAKDIAELKQQVAILSAKAIPLDVAYAQMLLAKMTHLHTPEMDGLLAKMGADLEKDIGEASSLTMEDAEALAAGLKEKVNDPNLEEAERIAADLLQGVVRLNVLAKQQEAEKGTETILVTRPATETVSTSAGPSEEEKE